MLYKRTTQTSNDLFDIHLKTLKGSELKVLLTIIRKTVGMYDRKTSTRVEWAWISQRLFRICTGLSGKAVSDAISSLLEKKLIQIKNEKGNLVRSKSQRRASTKLYYSSNSLLESSKNTKPSELTCTDVVKKVHTIKLRPIKPLCEKSTQGIRKLSDRERILQLTQQKKINRNLQ